MTRIASLLAVPLGILLSLTMATSAEAKYKKPRESCETRIFQKDDEACFAVNGEYVLFRRGVTSPDPDVELLRKPEEQADGFTLNGAPCGCQLLRRLDLICAGPFGAVIGSVDRRGKWIRGEVLQGRQTKLAAEKVARETQSKFFAKRVDVSECVILER